MKLEQSFSVAAPVEEVWAALVDIERVAGCLPGARITDRMDDGSFVGTLSFEGAGPAVVHDGVVKLDSLDPAAHSVTISVKGADRDGVGSVRASLLGTARQDGAGTVVDVAADVTLDGHAEDPVAGDDVLGRLLAQFAGRLEADLAAAGGQGPPPLTPLATPELPAEDEPAPPIPPPLPSREDQYAAVFGSEPEEPLAVPAPPEHPAPHGDPLTPEHREPLPPAEPHPEPVDPAPPHGDPLASPEPAASAAPLPPEPPAAPPPAPPPPAAAPPPAAPAPPPPVHDSAPTERASIPPPGYERDAPAPRAKPKAERSPGAGLGARLKALFSRKR
jgi:uncharacterized protein